MTTAMMLLHTMFESLCTIDADIRLAHSCNFGSLLSFAVNDHECRVKGIQVLFK
jgi:hypothetical protein